MRRFYSPNPVIANTIELPEEESKHILRVLRMSEGDSIEVFDGKGNLFTGSIQKLSNKKISLNIEQTYSEQEDTPRLHIAIAPTKNIDRTEWFIEKAVEAGINKITLLYCQNSERKQTKIERISKKAISALKQSKGLWLPEIIEVKSISDFVQTPMEEMKFVAHCYDDPEKKTLPEALKPTNNTLFLIGPEGDFTLEEVALLRSSGFTTIDLGKKRLRTETAGIFVCNAFHFTNFRS